MPAPRLLDAPPEEELLARLSSQVASRLGLNIPRKRWGALLKALRGYAQETGCAAPAECALRLLDSGTSDADLLALASRVTVGETYFFRDPELLSVLESRILAPLVEERRGRNQRLRIMSAGCSTGEEAYTMAILLRRLVPDLADWKVTVLGVDLNERALDKARAGLYSSWSFRQGEIPSPVSFTPEAGRQWRVRPEVRDMVTFLPLNLAGDAYPSPLNNTTAMDLVLCRNVLMYFVPEMAAAALGRLRDCLAPGGRLVLGPSEVVLAQVPGLESTGHVGVLTRAAPRTAAPAQFPPEAAPALAPPAWPEAPGEPLDPAPLAREEPPEVRAGTAPAPADLARGHYLAGRYDQAVDAADAAVQAADPAEGAQWLDAFRILVRSLANLREYSRADLAVRQAIARDKLNPLLHYLRASILLEEDPGLRLAEAREELRRALFLDGRFVPAHFLLGKLAREEGREAAARKHFANARTIVGALAKDQVLEGGEGMTAGGMASLLDALAPRRGKP